MQDGLNRIDEIHFLTLLVMAYSIASELGLQEFLGGKIEGLQREDDSGILTL